MFMHIDFLNGGCFSNVACSYIKKFLQQTMMSCTFIVAFYKNITFVTNWTSKLTLKLIYASCSILWAIPLKSLNELNIRTRYNHLKYNFKVFEQKYEIMFTLFFGRLGYGLSGESWDCFRISTNCLAESIWWFTWSYVCS